MVEIYKNIIFYMSTSVSADPTDRKFCLPKIAMKMAGPTILSITLSDDSDKLNLEPTNYRQNNSIFNFKIQDMVQPSS